MLIDKSLITKEFILTDPESLLNEIVPPDGATRELEKATALMENELKMRCSSSEKR